MNPRIYIALLAYLALAFGAACNGQGWTDPGPHADVDRTHRVVGASFDEQIRLCDWLAGRLGGYGQSRKCGQIPVTSTPSQSQCIAGLPDMPECTLTFGELEDCLNVLINGPCDADEFPPACYPVGDCSEFGP